MSDCLFKEMKYLIPMNPERMSVEDLHKCEKHLGETRVRIRRIQLAIREIMQSKGWSPEEPERIFAQGVPSPKEVGTPGG
jgi:hypothetical protein